jgi:hypothetical protein
LGRTIDDDAIARAEYAKRYDVVKYGNRYGGDSSKSYPNAKKEFDELSRVVPIGERKKVEALVDKKYSDQDLDAKRKRLMPEYKKGGIVKKTGPAIVHKGELVIAKPTNFEKAMSQRRLLNAVDHGWKPTGKRKVSKL